MLLMNYEFLVSLTLREKGKVFSSCLVCTLLLYASISPFFFKVKTKFSTVSGQMIKCFTWSVYESHIFLPDPPT